MEHCVERRLAPSKKTRRCRAVDPDRFQRLYRQKLLDRRYWYAPKYGPMGVVSYVRMLPKVVPSGSRQSMEKTTDHGARSPKNVCKNDKFKENLLRKRRTYDKYFERGLVAVDAALRRVAIFRGSHGERVVEADYVDRNGDLQPAGFSRKVALASPEAVSLMKDAIRGVASQKEKNSLKKYAMRCVARRSGGQRRRDNRLLNWELHQKRREKEERSRLFDIKLSAVEQYYADGGRQPGRNERLGFILVLNLVGKPIDAIVLPPTRDPASAEPFYFDESGRRIRARFAFPNLV